MTLGSNIQIARVFFDENKPSESETVITLLEENGFDVISMPAIGLNGPKVKVIGCTYSGIDEVKEFVYSNNGKI